MDVFLDAFFAIDTDNSEEITIDELMAYMVKNNFEEDFVQKWLQTFDEDRNGRITLDEYCHVLGLLPRSARIYRQTTHKTSAAPSILKKEAIKRNLPSSIQVITQDMPMDMQIDLAEVAKIGLDKGDTEREIARRLKQLLDQKYGRLWHVVVLMGQYWMNYSHEPDGSFHFKLGRHIFLLWKTPSG